MNLGKRICSVVQLAALICALLPVNSPLNAQVTGATLTGTVTDSNGNVIPAVLVTIISVSRGTQRVVDSNQDGVYVAPNLTPGVYKVQFAAPGFRTKIKQGLTLTVGERSTINIALAIGAVDQTVEVNATSNGIESASSALSAVVSGATTRELPLNGRDWTQLATLQPGIAAIRSQPDATSTASRGNRGFGQQLTISGGRPQQNSYRLDGIIINDYANSAPGSTAGLSLGSDSIQEFSVVSSNYSASYGMTSGGVINAITRSGTNKLHGSLYEFVRNDLFDAEGYFDQSKLPFRRNQFGATLGGPVMKDKTFLFGNYEGFRQVYTTTTNATTLTAKARTGALTAGDVKVDSNVARYLAFWPLPNNPANAAGDTGTYSFGSKEFTPEQFFTIRADQTLSSKDSLFATYLYDNGTTQQPDGLNILTNLSRTRRQVVSIAENHIFSSSFYNSLRVGVNRENAGTLITLPGANSMGTDISYGASAGLYAPGITVSGLTTFAGGLNSSSLATYGFTTPQLTDDAFLAKGKHTIKFGFAYENILSNTTQQTAPDGLFKFNSIKLFLTNTPASLQVQLTPGTPRDMRQKIYGTYVEDDWRIRENFTLTIGLRYEPASVPAEKAGKLSNLRSLTAAAPVTGSPFFLNPTYKNIEPRVGFVYSPTANHGQTTFSGGYGLFDVLPLTYQFNLMTTQAAPYMVNLSSTSLPAGSFPKAAYALVSATSAGKQRVTYVQYSPPRNYVQQWNLTLQQQLPAAINFKLGYVGSHGVHQALRTTDANVPVPAISSTGDLIFPCTPTSSTNLNCKSGAAPINPAYGQIDGQNWAAGSVYSGLLVQVKQTLKSFQWQASFTWQKSIDTNSSVIAGGPFLNSISGQLLFHPLRGVSDFDVPKVFVANAIWNAPDAAARGSVASYFVNGWELGGIFQVANGQPFTPVMTGDPLFLGNTVPFDVPDRLQSPGCEGNAVNTGTKNALHYIKTQCFTTPVNNSNIRPGTRFGNAGRNSLFGPGYMDLDFSMMKNIAVPTLGEATHLQFRAEAFNVANRPNLAAPYSNNKLFLASSGQITTASPPRQVQLGLKLIF